MRKFLLPIFIISLLSGLAACDQGARQEGDDEMENAEDTTAQAGQNQNITVSPAQDFKEFPDAKLTLQEPEEGTKLKEGKVKFNFNVQNFELGQQTENAQNLMLANSDQGQHIHFILDNDPYSAHYEPTFEKELTAGNHVVLAFLSRSYHASVKNKDAFIVKQFTVGDEQDTSNNVDLSKPHMFYSRPKGTYAGPDQTQKILLDFYLVNTDLGQIGNKIRATINGQEFMLDKWQPYVVEGLPMGENTFKLELLDSNGNTVESPFNPVTRTVTLKENKEE